MLTEHNFRVLQLGRARAFYERLGWHGQEAEETVFCQAGGMALILWGRAKLADDSGVPDRGAGDFDGAVREPGEQVQPDFGDNSPARAGA